MLMYASSSPGLQLYIKMTVYTTRCSSIDISDYASDLNKGLFSPQWNSPIVGPEIIKIIG